MLASRKFALSTAACAIALFYGAAAHAQATRTWVSGVGDDVNPCSRTAPCKTFAGAISKTAAGGEINCLDPGGFGAVTITKSMTINCVYTEGGVLAGGNGIVVNLPAATDVVYLRGLDIFGVNPPTNGVRFINRGTLHIEDSTIRRFNAANSAGVSVAPTAAARLYMNNVTVAENGNGATGGGIVIAPGAGGSVAATLINVRVRNNANNGLRIDSTSGAVTLLAEGGEYSGSANGISLQGTTNTIGAMFNNVIIAHNTTIGIIASGAPATMRIANSTISGNAVGTNSAGGASVLSYGTNRLDGNTANGTFTGAIIPTR